ncbi:MAG: polynucleotide adenylyltransferase [Verrucomicrobia bacterium]|nr:polynucleotide adenylyltransferase [Verrucomicrobiota bacterium]MDA1066537.1 polynucleotide adenylyltransferase [Verrucomicrobiota bacterium]
MKSYESTNFPVTPEVAGLLNAVAEIALPMIAGGAVRDWLMGKESKDLDVEVFGCSWEALIQVLEMYGKVNVVGKSFGVAKVCVGELEIDFALPRSEVKTADGHRGFDITSDPQLDPKQAALRRDFTLNAIYYSWKGKELFDPLNGKRDLENQVLKHCSSAFSEDPLRVLRGFQFCSRFQLKTSEETLVVCRNIQDDFAQLPRERVWMEWEKWATRATKPSLGLKFLKATSWLVRFPEINALVDCPQDPAWHPEGDVFVHTCYCLDAMAESEAFQKSDRFGRLTLMFGVLCHDFGKPQTTIKTLKDGKDHWVSPGHDQQGIPLSERFLLSIGAPMHLIPKVQALVGCHMASVQISSRPSLPQVRRLAKRVFPATMNQLFALIRADLAGRPPLSPDPNQGLLLLEEVVSEEKLSTNAPKPLVLGRHLIERGFHPGKDFKIILDELFEHQLDGHFSSLEEAEPYLKTLCDRFLN